MILAMGDFYVLITVAIAVGTGFLFLAIGALFKFVLASDARRAAAAKTPPLRRSALLRFGTPLAVGVAVLCFIGAGHTAYRWIEARSAVAASQEKMKKSAELQEKMSRLSKDYQQAIARPGLSAEERKRLSEEYQRACAELQNEMNSLYR